MTISELINLIRWDMRVNPGIHFDAVRAKLLLIEVRLEEFIYQNTCQHPNTLVTFIWYLCRGLGSVFQWFMCNSLIAGSVELGRGLRLPHPQNIIIVKYARIGEFCMIYQNVTIAWNGFYGDANREFSPKIGDCVLIGTGAIIIGNITVGSKVRIGAGSVITKSVPDNSIVKSPQPIITQFEVRPTAVEPGSELHLKDFYSIWK